ncbi:ferritin-like fold-containing protein [Arthrobacter sp. G119Y2]|uniref:ferritin-like fold-containing protein n=1 Tax=Arthrobacter sp. G119Y2 TaxID=3134965 RepID=UPI00311A8DD8
MTNRTRPDPLALQGPELRGSSPDAAELYQRFLADLFGVMAYGELSAFERMSSDARFSPTLHDRTVLGRLAVREYEHFERVSGHLRSLGLDPETAMQPFQPSVDAFHDRTRPADWFESLMKFYVTDGISDDFYQAVASRLDPVTAELVLGLQETEPSGAVLEERLRQALSDDPRLSSRLALWGRRLVGEALTQAQRVVLERAVLGGLLQDTEQGIYEDEVKTLFASLTRNHSRRMSRLGLTA